MDDEATEPFSSKRKREEDSSEDITYLEVPDSPNIQDEPIYETHELEEYLDDECYAQNNSIITEVHVEESKTHVEEKTTEKDDECSVFGKQIGLELQLMTPRQRIIAKKLLSDVAYYGRLERLTEHTEITCAKAPET